MEKFLRYLEYELNRSPLTVENYERDIRQFATWLHSEPSALLLPGGVTTNDIRAWLSSMAKQGITPASLRRKTQSLRAFFRWGVKTKRIVNNPAESITLAKLPRHLPEIVKNNDIEQILQSLSLEDPIQQRLHLAVTLIYTLGLRQAELLGLTDNSLRESPCGPELRIVGKGNKERILPLPESIMSEIKRWQTQRDVTYPNLTTPRPLIAGPHGHIAKDTLYKAIHQLLENTSATRKSPHTLRHSFATAMLSNGANLDAVRELLGHTSLSTTQIYTHLSPTQLREAYTNSHPRAKNTDDNKHK